MLVLVLVLVLVLALVLALALVLLVADGYSMYSMYFTSEYGRDHVRTKGKW